VVRDGPQERVLVLETLGAPPPPRRRRRRPRESDGEPSSLPLSRAMVIRAFAPFEDRDSAQRWLEQAISAEDATDAVIGEAGSVLVRALHAHAIASGDPYGQVLTPRRAVSARLGFGSGDEVANGQFTAAREVDLRRGDESRRRQRAELLRPQERLAALLGDREAADACETLVLRARADLDAGRMREAALQLRVGLEALLAELQGAVTDPGHEEDMGALAASRQQVGEIANRALQGDLDAAAAARVEELLATCERVLRRRRVLRG
jgi:hypothetical protein